jgi:polar amino acid transport system substrate-binding protein
MVAMACTLTVGTAGQAADFTIAALKGWPPFSGKNLRNKGFANDVTQTALERMGHDAEIKVMPWARALEMTKRGKFEVLPSVWYSDERADNLKFTDPIASNRIVFIKRQGDDFQYTGIDSLAGKSVGIVQDYDYSDDFLSADGFERQRANSLKINVRKLLGGRVDLTLGDELVAKYAINKNMPNQADKIAYTEGALSEKDLHVTFSRKLDNVDSIVADFNAELEAMREDGTYDEILKLHELK